MADQIIPPSGAPIVPIVNSDPLPIAIAFTTTGAANITTTENATATFVDALNFTWVTFWLEVTAVVSSPTEFTYAVRWSDDGASTSDSQKTEDIVAGVGTLTDYTAKDDISGKTPTYKRQFTVPTLGRRFVAFEASTDTGTATATVAYQRGK
jgi:hypothetical protein